MTKNEYIGYIGGALILIPIGALIAQYATQWIARFKPRYSKALISSVIAFVAMNAIGQLFMVSGNEILSRPSLRLLAALVILACCHIYFLSSEAGAKLSPGKAFLVAFCQLLGATVGLLVVLLILAGARHIFS